MASEIYFIKMATDAFIEIKEMTLKAKRCQSTS